MLVFDYPFSAVVGQAAFKQALLLAAINPSIGGVLISGPRGLAKSTLARALADILPRSEASLSTFVTLPLGASDEMLVGTLNLQKVLENKEVQFSPGLLAKANGGVLYVDEVNLLADSLVDLLLDVAASGVNVVERDAVSHTHAARFMLLGTMNPDEGELRAQLQDRFGLCVQLTNEYEPKQRVEIVRLRERFDRDPQAFLQCYDDEQYALTERLSAARGLLATVVCNDALRLQIAERSMAAGVDGLRADIVWCRAAMAHAAWRQSIHVESLDVDAVEELVLCHRRQSSQPPIQPPSPPPFSKPPENQRPQREQQSQQMNTSSLTQEEGLTASGDWGDMKPQRQMSLGQTVVLNEQALSTGLEATTNQVGRTQGNSVGGEHRSRKLSDKVDWPATLRHSMGRWPPMLRNKRQDRGQSRLHLLLIDTSASVLLGRGLAMAKEAALVVMEKAYLRREQVAVMSFGNESVDTLMAPSKARKQCRAFIDNIEAGGGTPLRQMLQQAAVMLNQWRQREPGLDCQSYLFTDGRSQQDFSSLSLPGHCLVADIEQSSIKRGRGLALAQALGADYMCLNSTGVKS